MSNIFNYDNKFFRAIGKIADCVCISLLWAAFSIPVVTIGAAATAMYYTVNKVIRGGRGYVWQSFWSSFKSNLRQTLVLGLVCLAAGVLLAVDAYISYQMLDQGNAMGSLYYLFLILIALLAVWACYLFTYTARFANTTRQIMKNAAMIAIANLPFSFLIFLIVALSVLALCLVPVAIVIIPGLATWILNGIFERIYRKYMSPEDLKQEEEYDLEARR